MFIFMLKHYPITVFLPMSLWKCTNFEQLHAENLQLRVLFIVEVELQGI